MLDLTAWRAAPMRPLAMAPRAARCERRPDGGLLLTSPRRLGPYGPSLGAFLQRWARERPESPFLAERATPGADGARPWRALTWAEAHRQARAIAQALLDRSMDERTPVLVLSGNSLEHALLTLGCLLAGVPISPISPGMSLLSQDLGKLKAIVGLLRPAMVFAQQGGGFDRALRWIGEATDAELVVAREPVEGLACTAFDALVATAATDAVERRAAAVGLDRVAKVLFTSGSTGQPKGVPNTHRMLCANQAMMEAVLPPDPAAPPVMVDWLPWSHTFGGNVIFNWVLRDGGTLYLDGGRPVPGAFDETLANLREVSPTHYFNVPLGYELLADALERDAALRARFFERLSFCYYGGASLPQRTWDRLQTLSVHETGTKLAFTTGCGSTETGPIATFLHWPVDSAGIVGLPLPGVRVKLVPVGERFEMRLAGEHVFEGYLGRPDLTAAAFDEEGFYRTGDAVSLVDPGAPEAGLVFEGRTTEDFKLASGTFVQSGTVRVALLSAVPLLRDVVLAGPGRPWLGALGWLEEGRARAVAEDPGASPEALASDPGVARALAAQLEAFNASAGGSSHRVAAIRLSLEPPSPDRGEITEKGYLNQLALLRTRAAEIGTLYGDPTS